MLFQRVKNPYRLLGILLCNAIPNQDQWCAADLPALYAAWRLPFKVDEVCSLRDIDYFFAYEDDRHAIVFFLGLVPPTALLYQCIWESKLSFAQSFFNLFVGNALSFHYVFPFIKYVFTPFWSEKVI